MPKSDSPGRILVADDDELVRKLIHTILNQHGHAVELCEDGDAALRRSLEGGWSLLILDLHMPGRTGLDVVRELREKGVGCPVILMSGMMEDGVIGEGSGLGNVEFVSKPLDVKKLIAIIGAIGS